jgi:hypothetical protein
VHGDHARHVEVSDTVSIRRTRLTAQGAVAHACPVEGCRGLLYNRAMRRVLDIGLIVGFLAVDFLFFHDIFKTGEVTTVPQYMTGLLSVLVFAMCSESLLKSARR